MKVDEVKGKMEAMKEAHAEEVDQLKEEEERLKAEMETMKEELATLEEDFDGEVQRVEGLQDHSA